MWRVGPRAAPYCAAVGSEGNYGASTPWRYADMPGAWSLCLVRLCGAAGLVHSGRSVCSAGMLRVGAVCALPLDACVYGDMEGSAAEPASAIPTVVCRARITIGPSLCHPSTTAPPMCTRGRGATGEQACCRSLLMWTAGAPAYPFICWCGGVHASRLVASGCAAVCWCTAPPALRLQG